MGVQSDREIVDAVVAGDRDRFAVLVTRYGRLALSAAACILQDKHAAEDVAQDAFVTAYERLNALRDPDAFGPWLLKITRRLALRSTHRRPRLQRLPETACDKHAEQDGRFDARSMEVLSLVQRLPQHERLVVLLKYFDEHSVSEIAEIIGRPVGTVTKKLTRARKRLEVWLKEKDNDI